MFRRSFLPPVPEFEIAANLLSHAADALLARDLESCALLLTQADLRPLREFSLKVTGSIDPSIHRQSKPPKVRPTEGKGRPRMPARSAQLRIMQRDGFRCRFCEVRVLVREAHVAFAAVLPLQARLGSTNESKHFGLATLTGSIDHIIPYSRGGTNETDNLVTACGPCQFGRGHWTLEEVEIEDPRRHPPLTGSWDGLSRLLPLLRARSN